MNRRDRRFLAAKARRENRGARVIPPSAFAVPPQTAPERAALPDNERIFLNDEDDLSGEEQTSMNQQPMNGTQGPQADFRVEIQPDGQTVILRFWTHIPGAMAVEQRIITSVASATAFAEAIARAVKERPRVALVRG